MRPEARDPKLYASFQCLYPVYFDATRTRAEGRRVSAAQAVATAGSAVVFAGLTVMIALCGLAVARIPFLTTMGVAAAVGVAIAVTIALTMLPALIGFAGPRVVAATVKQALPDGFQTSEFLLAHGFVYRIVPRPELRGELSRIIDYCGR